LISDIEPLQDVKVGFEQAIRNVIQQRFTTLGVNVSLHCGSEIPEMDKFCMINILRIIQEALFNAQKHAQSNSIGVKIYEKNSRFCVDIRDNGIGFDQHALTRNDNRHFGILSMRERTHLIGGTLKIHSKLNKGTTVHAEFPLSSLSSQ
jgi:signal transduction histidine kinase